MRLCIGLGLCLIICTTAAIIGAYLYYLKISANLPEISSLTDYHPPVISCVYSDDGKKIAEFFNERRIVVPLSQMPKHLIHAFVASEDSRFYEHEGYDIRSIIRAFIKNLQAGEVVQGGSTITQQVTKSFLLTPERKYERKFKEAILAYRIDKKFSKEQILYLYLNQIYLGHGAYGVAAAAENYFGKSVEELNLAECAMLAGLPKAPSDNSPYRHFEKAKERQLYVLRRMVEENYITEAEAEMARKTPIQIHKRRNLYLETVPYYTEHVRKLVEEKYGKDTLYNEGLQIYTAVNIDLQIAARQAIDRGLRELDKRHGYRGPEAHLDPEQIEAFSQKLQKEMAENKIDPKPGLILKGVVIKVDNRNKRAVVRMGKYQGQLHVSDMRWARTPNLKVSYKQARRVKHPGEVLNVGDVILVRIKEPSKDNHTNKKSKANTTTKETLLSLALEQTPQVQSALICLETGTGLVKAMVGGRDFKVSQFNRAIQSKRQPGSAFKPIVYCAALDKGYTPASELMDNAFVARIPNKARKWKPKNYDRKFSGFILMRQALAHSRNLATINLLADIGLDYTMEYAKRFGITSELNPDLSTALGSSGISLFEMTQAYSVFANQGELISPVFITRILDRNGKEIYRSQVEKRRAIEESTAYLMTSMLESVVKEGTGQRVKKLGRPVAGKTGTTNNLHDAWFMGYTTEYVTGVWVGYDEEKSLGSGESGGRAASPIWLYFMQKATEGKPIKSFTMPGDVVFAKIDAKTGKLASPDSQVTYFECFKEGTVPKVQSQTADKVTASDQFFKSDI